MASSKYPRSLVFMTIPLVLLLKSQYSYSLDLEGAKEVACFEIPNPTSADLEWMLSTKKWYYVMMSRLDLYRLSLDVTQKSPTELNENTLYYDGCVSWEMNPADPSFTAFGQGKQVRYMAKPLQENFKKFQFISDHGPKYSGTAHISLTDNSTFLMYVSCMDDMNQMTWTIGSPYKSLKKETVDLIHDHAESLGFKREHFTALSYEGCDKKKQEELEKDEL